MPYIFPTLHRTIEKYIFTYIYIYSWNSLNVPHFVLREEILSYTGKETPHLGFRQFELKRSILYNLRHRERERERERESLGTFSEIRKFLCSSYRVCIVYTVAVCVHHIYSIRRGIINYVNAIYVFFGYSEERERVWVHFQR